MANIPDPITRKEQYYSYMAGESSYLPDPITREEKYLYYLCVNGSGGGESGGSGGTTNYNDLTNKPSINGVELSGNKTSDDLGISGMTEEQEEQLNQNTQDIQGKVSKDQGTLNAGKVLGIGADGMVTPMDPPQGMTEEQVAQLNQATEDILTKVDKDQGTENAGKVLGIGSDGMVTPVEGTDTQKQLENAIANYYALRRTGKVYQTKLWKFATNPTSSGVKQLDNEGLVFEPSTDTAEGQDDYLNGQNPLFEWVHVNYIRDDDGTARPIAIEGMDDYKTSGAVDVGAMQMCFYWKWDSSNAEYDLITISDTPHPELGLVPWCESVKADGTVLPWCIGSAYVSGTASDGLLRSQPGLPPERNQSHNNMITNYQKKGEGYWGAGACRNTFQFIFNAIKGATKNSQSLFAGVTKLSSMHAHSGTTDVVKGRHDGSPVSNTDAKHPYRVQGREYAVGGYIVASDTVAYLNADGSRTVYTAEKGTAHSNNQETILSTYKNAGTIPNSATGTAADWYIGDLSLDENTAAWWPSAEGSGSTQGICDRYYAGGSASDTLREYLQGGALGDGSNAGVGHLALNGALSSGDWYFLACD